MTLCTLFLMLLALSYLLGVLLERYGRALPHTRQVLSYSSDIAMHRNEPLLAEWLVDHPGLDDRTPEFVYVDRQPWSMGRSQVAGPNMEYKVLQTLGGYPLWSVQNQLWCYPGSPLLPRDVAVWNMPWAGRPLWPGLFGNAVVYLIILVAWSYVLAARFKQRMNRGQCAHCKYHCDNLQTCPECGREPYLRYAHGLWRIDKPSAQA